VGLVVKMKLKLTEISGIFKNLFSEVNKARVKKLISTVVTIINESFCGCIIGNEKFTFYYSVQFLKNIIRAVAVIILLQLGFKSVTVAFVDLIMVLMFLLCNILYSLFFLKERCSSFAGKINIM
jgi:hypothetical protein